MDPSMGHPLSPNLGVEGGILPWRQSGSLAGLLSPAAPLLRLAGVFLEAVSPP